MNQLVVRRLRVVRGGRRWAEVCPLERAYAEAVAGLRRVADEIRDAAWVLEEFRVSLLAQPVG